MTLNFALKYVLQVGFPVAFLVLALVAYRQVRMRALGWLVAAQGLAVASVVAMCAMMYGWLHRLPHLAPGAGPSERAAWAQQMSAMHQMISVTADVRTVIDFALTATFVIVLMHEVEKLQAAKAAAQIES